MQFVMVLVVLQSDLNKIQTEEQYERGFDGLGLALHLTSLRYHGQIWLIHVALLRRA